PGKPPEHPQARIKQEQLPGTEDKVAPAKGRGLMANVDDAFLNRKAWADEETKAREQLQAWMESQEPPIARMHDPNTGKEAVIEVSDPKKKVHVRNRPKED
ncbi:unnamed protein product, partial [marine sediment metagenome]